MLKILLLSLFLSVSCTKTEQTNNPEPNKPANLNVTKPNDNLGSIGFNLDDNATADNIAALAEDLLLQDLNAPNSALLGSYPAFGNIYHANRKDLISGLQNLSTSQILVQANAMDMNAFVGQIADPLIIAVGFVALNQFLAKFNSAKTPSLGFSAHPTVDTALVQQFNNLEKNYLAQLGTPIFSYNQFTINSTRFLNILNLLFSNAVTSTTTSTSLNLADGTQGTIAPLIDDAIVALADETLNVEAKVGDILIKQKSLTQQRDDALTKATSQRAYNYAMSQMLTEKAAELKKQLEEVNQALEELKAAARMDTPKYPLVRDELLLAKQRSLAGDSDTEVKAALLEKLHEYNIPFLVGENSITKFLAKVKKNSGAKPILSVSVLPRSESRSSQASTETYTSHGEVGSPGSSRTPSPTGSRSPHSPIRFGLDDTNNSDSQSQAQIDAVDFTSQPVLTKMTILMSIWVYSQLNQPKANY